MASGVGSVSLLLGQQGDSLACVADQMEPRWGGHERSFAAEGATVSRLGCGGFGLLLHARQFSTLPPAGAEFNWRLKSPNMRERLQKGRDKVPKFYLYKMTVDDGGAPCVQDGLLTLAICKPTIRRVAPEGSVIFAFAGNCMDSEGYRDNCIVYAAVVSRRVPNCEYYSKRQYAHRQDCIYKRNGSGFALKAKAKFHRGPGDLEHDLGAAPDYPNAVLLSDGVRDFRYFGTKCPVKYKKTFPRLRRLIERLAEGHRVNHDPVLYK